MSPGIGGVMAAPMVVIMMEIARGWSAPVTRERAAVDVGHREGRPRGERKRGRCILR